MNGKRPRPGSGWFSRDVLAAVGPPVTVRGQVFTTPWLAAATVAAGAGAALGSRPLIVLGVLVLACAAGMRGWTVLMLRGVNLETAVSETRCLPGDRVRITTTLTNRGPLPLPWLILDLDLGIGLRVLDRAPAPGGDPGRQSIRIRSRLGPFERVTWTTDVACEARGIHPVGPLTLRAGDPFGFFVARQDQPAAEPVVVFPRFRSRLDLRLPLRDPLGSTRVRHLLQRDPSRIAGVRAYQPGDPYRSIHWRATARLGEIQVRVEEPSGGVRLGIFLNLDTFDHYWEGLDTALAERAISVAASLARWADDLGASVGLYANGLTAGTDRTLRVPPRRGRDHQASMLGGLASISPFSTVPFEKVLRAETVRFPPGSTLIVITARLPEATQALIVRLLAARQSVILVPLGDCPRPAIPGLLIQHDLSGVLDGEIEPVDGPGTIAAVGPEPHGDVA